MQLSDVAALMEVVQNCRVDIVLQCCGILASQPRMLQGLVGSEPILWLELHQIINPVHGIFTDLIPNFVVVIVVACDDVSLNLAVGALEWERAAQHCVGDDTDRPKIATRIVVGTLDDLWCHEVDGSAISVQINLFISMLRVL